MATTPATSDSPKARCLIQQCTQTKLKTSVENDDFVEIQRGAVFFICFFKGAEKSDVDKLIKSILNVKLSETNDNQHVSILDLPGSILIIPQATLGGRVKAKAVQYHNNVDKEIGRELFDYFIKTIEFLCKENVKWSSADCVVKSGTYGIRQVYSTQTNGPYLHIVEF